MRFTEPGLSEGALAAHFEYLCALKGSERPAYVPVVASGSNALVIHYTANDCILSKDDLILMDAGGELQSVCITLLVKILSDASPRLVAMSLISVRIAIAFDPRASFKLTVWLARPNMARIRDVFWSTTRAVPGMFPYREFSFQCSVSWCDG